MSLLNLSNIHKIYKEGKVEVPALNGITLEIEKEEFTTIFGPSGSGKTTLLNLIGCLDTPTEGKIIFNGKEIENLSKKELAMIRRYDIGFIFQDYNLIPVLTVYENIELALRLLKNISDKQIKEKVNNILNEVGLTGLGNRMPNELSGGQKQRVAIARALVKSPKIVFADEPTANIDSKTSAEVLDVMLNMNKEFGTTFIFSTHDPHVMKYAKRLIELEDGRIIKDKKQEGE